MANKSNLVKKITTNNLDIVLDLVLSKVWKGYGSALFLELGNLHEELAWKRDSKPTTSTVGEFTLSSAGSWKLFKGVKSKNKSYQIDGLILDGEKATVFEIKNTIKNLESRKIKSIELTDKLVLGLSNNLILEFNNTDYGFFTLTSNVKSVISYKNNSLIAYHSIL